MVFSTARSTDSEGTHQNAPVFGCAAATPALGGTVEFDASCRHQNTATRAACSARTAPWFVAAHATTANAGFVGIALTPTRTAVRRVTLDVFAFSVATGVSSGAAGTGATAAKTIDTGFPDIAPSVAGTTVYRIGGKVTTYARAANAGLLSRTRFSPAHTPAIATCRARLRGATLVAGAAILGVGLDVHATVSAAYHASRTGGIAIQNLTRAFETESSLRTLVAATTAIVVVVSNIDADATAAIFSFGARWFAWHIDADPPLATLRGGAGVSAAPAMTVVRCNIGAAPLAAMIGWGTFGSRVTGTYAGNTQVSQR